MASLRSRQVKEFPVPQRCNNPALCHLNSRLRPWLYRVVYRASGHHGEAIMLGQFAIGGIQFRLITAGMLDARFGVVGNDDFRRSTHKFQSADMRTRSSTTDPGFGWLRQRCNCWRPERRQTARLGNPLPRCAGHKWGFCRRHSPRTASLRRGIRAGETTSSLRTQWR